MHSVPLLEDRVSLHRLFASRFDWTRPKFFSQNFLDIEPTFAPLSQVHPILPRLAVQIYS